MLTGIYFSGTGNTRYCVETFVHRLDATATVLPIESPDVLAQIARYDTIVLGYPIYFSNLPKIVRDFLLQNGSHFRGKTVYLLATMGLFSGDGTGCAARILRKHGVAIAGGLHLKMPDCIGDEKALKRPLEENCHLVAAAGEKIALAADRWQSGTPHQDGLGFPAHVAGLLGQRLWFSGKTASYKQKPVVDLEKCIGCGRCVALCPMGNLSIRDGKAVSGGRCTLCYRCFSQCPEQALTILGKQVYDQCRIEKYL